MWILPVEERRQSLEFPNRTKITKFVSLLSIKDCYNVRNDVRVYILVKEECL